MDGKFLDNPAGPAHAHGHDGRPLWRYRYAQGTEVLVYRAADGRHFVYRAPTGNRSATVIGGALAGLAVGSAGGPLGAFIGAAIGAALAGAVAGDD